MFGLDFEKILVIAAIGAFLLGPQRLPLYASKLAALTRRLREMTEDAKSAVRDELGPDFDGIEWKKLDPRQYDPRHIVKIALSADADDAPRGDREAPADDTGEPLPLGFLNADRPE